MLKIALIGCGRHAQGNHAAPLARYASEHPDTVELAAACDLDTRKAETFCDQFGFARAFDDMDSMLEEVRPDACVCVMPVSLIVQVGEVLLERGMPCLLEKPPGATLAEVERLASVAKRTGTPHMISVNRRFMPLLNRAIRWARERGPIQFVDAAVYRTARTEADFVWSTGIHSIDASRHIGGEVVDYNFRVLRDGLSANWYEVTFHFASGCAGRLRMFTTCGLLEESYHIYGDEYCARFSTDVSSGGTCRGWERGEMTLDEDTVDEPPDVVCGAYGEVEELVGALISGRCPRPTVHDVLPSARIGFGIFDKVTGE